MQQTKDAGYKKLPNHGTLFKSVKTEDSQPSYKGYLLLDRAMIENLLKASNGDIELDVSLWRKETKSGAINLNLQCEAKGGKPKPPADPQAYLNKLKVKIAACNSLKDFEELYKKINSPEVWQVFKSVPAIAQEASTILSEKKAQLVLGAEPIDLSSILSALDVECDRLNLGRSEHCLARWNKPRAMLSIEELEIYLEELRSAKPVAIADEFF
jgi:hypothetical protein